MPTFVMLTRWFVFWPMLIGMSLPCLFGGLPIWIETGESLLEPRKVRSIEDDALVLADGTRLPIPHVTKIPATVPLLKAAVSDGVEINPNGDVIGLLWERQMCGMTAISRHRRRINLTHLVAAIAPELLKSKLDIEDFNILKDQTLAVEIQNDVLLDYHSVRSISHCRDVLSSKISPPVVKQDEPSEPFLAAISCRVLTQVATTRVQLILAAFGVVTAISLRGWLLCSVIILASGVLSVLMSGYLIAEWWNELVNAVQTTADALWRADHDGGLWLEYFAIMLKASVGVAVAFVVHRSVEKGIRTIETPPDEASLR